MLEDQVANLLQRYLGNYVRGLNKEALEISVWQEILQKYYELFCYLSINFVRRKLAFGWWKVNYVGAWREETAISGTGWVIRNNSGWFQLGGGRGGVRAASGLAIESMAVREALWAYVEKGASNCGV
ncbi:vacuolar protein sorting-associated protein 13F [Pyrus ussuriensis x Pyrus communis]|uniref:Vacuolar protein sorting-associated protein 13F n=1 Tax=Pyrus ussuriensis x Pyrus communis TaxID=2448454 RepID=A0A5N5I7T6_9ROSA|nr:vacuolar protein sorting-associated protein 13F [Pyrus ussuriensis x Pyrus communis]